MCIYIYVGCCVRASAGRLVSDYLAKISLKCCSCGNDIIRVRQGQLAVIKAGRGPVQRAWMKLRRVAKMAGRLHGSTSLCLCDNKTNLHTGQLVPGRMSSLPLFLSGRNFPRIDGGPVEIIGGKRLERKLSVKTDRYPLCLEYQVCVCVCVGVWSCTRARLILQRKFWDGFVK